MLGAISIVAFLGAVASAQLTPNQLSYAPTFVRCPTNFTWIRPATSLSPQESDWVNQRKVVVAEALATYLSHLDLTGFDHVNYMSLLKKASLADVPTLGLALSGGGYESAFTGTALMRAMDNRLQAANDQRIGGLLQSLTYTSGQSGGAWPVLSFALYNFPTADQILSDWMPQIDRLNGVTNNSQYVETPATIFGDMAAKLRKGFNISTADYFGRQYSLEFIPGAYGGVNTTLSSLQNVSNFVTHQMPFPLIQAIEILPTDPTYFGLQIPKPNASIFEIGPFEFGTWDGSVRAFTPTKWLGTPLLNGKPANSSICVNKFDQAGFVLGTSGAAVNFWYIENKSNNTIAPFAKRSMEEETSLAKRANPPSETSLDSLFAGFSEEFNLTLQEIAYATTKSLRLVDGSESGQQLPLWVQIQPERDLDFIITTDASEDAAPYNWNNGTNLRDTYLAADAAGIPFPVVPDAATFVNRNYTTSPVFFGCDAALTTTKSTDSPIVLYLANAPYSAYTNFSFTQSAVSMPQVQEIFTNGFNILSQGNGTLDKEWPECLGCAVIDRSLGKVGLNRTAQCSQCFKKYCWDGTSDDAPAPIVNPTLRLYPNVTFIEWNKTHPF